MPHQLGSAPGRGTGPDGSPVFLVKAPGLFATWVYPFSLFLLWVAGQPLALWLCLCAGAYAHGVRYPRTFGTFYPLYFWLTILGVLSLPSLYMLLNLVAVVDVTPWSP